VKRMMDLLLVARLHAREHVGEDAALHPLPSHLLAPLHAVLVHLLLLARLHHAAHAAQIHAAVVQAHDGRGGGRRRHLDARGGVGGEGGRHPLLLFRGMALLLLLLAVLGGSAQEQVAARTSALFQYRQILNCSKKN